MSIADNLREQFADLCHRQWTGWMEWMLDRLNPESIARWRRQMATKYCDLSEREKESDRKEADRFLALLSPANNAQQRDELAAECDAWIERVEALSDASKLEDENTRLSEALRGLLQVAPRNNPDAEQRFQKALKALGEENK